MDSDDEAAQLAELTALWQTLPAIRPAFLDLGRRFRTLAPLLRAAGPVEAQRLLEQVEGEFAQDLHAQLAARQRALRQPPQD